MRNGKKILALLVALLMVFAAFTVSATPANPDREAAHAQTARETAAQSMVLLKNNNRTLPIRTADRVAVFGNGAYNCIYGGTGSGAVNNRYNINYYTGLHEANVRVDATVEAFYSQGNAQYETRVPTEDLVTDAADENNKAIYVIARTSGEGSDRWNTLTPQLYGTNNSNVSQFSTNYQLNPTEKETLTLLQKYFTNIIVVLDVGGIIDLKAVNVPGVDSILASWQGGQELGRAAADVLTGKVNPSGKLNDTWAINYEDYSSSANMHAGGSGPHKTYADYGLDPDLNGNLYNATPLTGTQPAVYYQEGIYVGYRYFDTFGKAVQYPFGFGLSYTTFSISEQSVVFDKTLPAIKVTAKVTNTGTVAGAEVVQAYFSAPDAAGVEKPYQELAGFAKTDLLAPGASQTVTILFDVSDLSSYHYNRSAYIVDPGQYLFRVGNSSRNTKVCAKTTIAAEVVTEQLTRQWDMTANAKAVLPALYSKAGATPITYATEAAEIAAAPSIALSASDFTIYDPKSVVPKPTELGASKYPNVTFFLQAVKEGTITMEDYIRQFTDAELCGMGTGSNSGTVDGVATNTWLTKSRMCPGAAAHSNAIRRVGMPSVTLPDGPAGIRLTRVGTYNPGTGYDRERIPYAGDAYEHNSTRWANTSAQACSWDINVLERIGQAIGVEALAFRADYWLAPALNIHRTPLNGRNFEYYSEDPVLAGQMAAYNTLGVQSVKNDEGYGPGVTLKHFALNQCELNRSGAAAVDTIVDERTIREIYLHGFEIAVKQANPYCIMTSYNRVNANYDQCSYDLCENITRGEWGFKGVIMTDWGANGTKGNTLAAGNDIIMPGETVTNLLTKIGADNPKDTVTRAQLQKNAMRIAEVVTRTAAMTEYIDTKAVLADPTAIINANKDFQVKVTAPADITDMVVINEAGNAVSKKAVSKSAEVDGKVVWTLTLQIATAGSNRILSFYTAKGAGYMPSGATVKVDVMPVVDDGTGLVSAGFTNNITTTKVNVPTEITVVTKNPAITVVDIYNANGSKMGKTLVSKTANADGTVTWKYTIKIGSAGKARGFYVEAGGIKSAVFTIDVTLI